MYICIQTKQCLDHNINCWKRRTLCTSFIFCYHFKVTVNAPIALKSKYYQAPVTTHGFYLLSGLYLTIKIGTGTCTKTHCYTIKIRQLLMKVQTANTYETFTVNAEITAAWQATLSLLFTEQLWLWLTSCSGITISHASQARTEELLLYAPVLKWPTGSRSCDFLVRRKSGYRPSNSYSSTPVSWTTVLKWAHSHSVTQV